MSSSERQKFEYDSLEELKDDYKKLMSNQNNLNIATEYLYESLVDEAILGIVFQMHFESKFPVSLSTIFIQNILFYFFQIGIQFQEVFATSEDSKKSSSSHSDYGASSSNKFLNCKCLNCEKTVSANKYASHLENCLGIGRTSSRIASRKKTTNSSAYYDYPEYDDDAESDANWSAKEKTKKKQGSNGRNGKNKSKNYM